MYTKNQWVFAFSNTAFFKWLENKRHYVVYPILTLLITSNLLWLFLPVPTVLAYKTILAVVVSIVALWGVDIYFSCQMNWLSTNVAISLDTFKIPRLKHTIKWILKLFDISEFIGVVTSTLLTSLVFYLLLTVKSAFIADNVHLVSLVQQAFISNTSKATELREFLGNLWQIDATVVSITFVVLTLLLELVKSTQPDVVTFIVKKIRLIPIVAINFFLLLPIGFLTLGITSETESVNNIIFLACLMFFSYSIFSTIYVFLKSVVFIDQAAALKSINESLKDALRATFLEELYLRMAHNTLISIGDSNKFSGSGIDFGDSHSAVRIHVQHKSRIEDINIHKIIKIAANLSGTVSGRGEKLSITVTPESWIDPDHCVVARINKTDLNKTVESRIKSCFKVSVIKENLHDITDFANALRDQAADTINRNLTKSYKDVLDTYYGLYECFYATLDRLGVKFDFKSARSSFIETRSMRVVEQSIKEVLDEAFKSDNENLLLDTMYFPKRLLTLALEQKDHLLFMQGLHLFSYMQFLYYKYDYKGKKIGKLVIDRLHRHISEFCDYDLFRVFEEEDYALQHIEFLNGVLTETLLLFNLYMKTCIDKQDIGSLRELSNAFNKILERVIRNFNQYERIKDILEFSTEAEKEAKIEKIDDLLKIEEELTQHKKLIRYGLASWVVNLIVSGNVLIDFGKDAYSLLSSDLTKLKDLTEAFFAADTREWANVYGWDWWEINEHEYGEVHSIDKNWLKDTYILKALTSLNSGASAIAYKALPNSKDAKEYNSSGLTYTRSELQNRIEFIEKNIVLYTPIFDPAYLSKKDTLLTMHADGIAEVKINEDKHLEESELDQEKIDEFKNDIIKAWSENSDLRSIFENENNITRTEIEPDKLVGYRGYNKLEPKEMFIKDPVSSYSGWGDGYGSGIADAENNLLYNEIHKEVLESSQITPDNLSAEIEKGIQALKDAGFNPTVILTNSSLLYRLHGDGKFTYNYMSPKSKFKNIQGLFLGIPVISCNTDKTLPSFIILDTKKIGEIIQYCKDSTAEVFSFSVRAFTKDVFAELIKDNPNMLKREDGTDKNAEEVYKDLQTKVWFKLLESIEFKVKDGKAGFVLSVVGEED